MGTVYATSADLLPRIGDRPLTSTTRPSTQQVNAWIEEAEAALEGALRAGGISIPISDARGRTQLRAWVLDYAEGHYRSSNAAAGGDSNNDDGVDLLVKFDTLITAILDNPARYGAMLEVGGNASDASRRLRAHPLDDVDGRSTGEGGDLAPYFNVADKGDQF